ncbi:MAG: glycosyl hydrolase [Candidatus Micrarchaeaceae archaeon]
MKKYFILIGVFILIVVFLIFLNINNSNNKAMITNITKKYSQKFCINAANNNTVMNIATSNGIDCFRTDISFSSSKNAIITNVINNHGEYLGILDYQTVNAQPSQNGCTSGCNWTLNTWNASIYNALKSYPEITEWEIYNEPLVGEFQSGYENGSALHYFNMIKSAYVIIKKSEPNATIVCFGGAELFPLSEVQQEYYFYKAVWDYGASKYCNAISIHAYSIPFYNLNQEAYQNITVAQVYNFTLNLYENLTKKPIWITETGIPSNNWTQGINFSQKKQALFLTQEIMFFSNYSFIKRVYWYDLLGSTNGGADFGLLNSTTTIPKPAFYNFLYFVKNES